MKVLVIGANGYLGPHVVKAIGKHHELLITDIKPPPEPTPHEFRLVDVTSLEQVMDAAKGMLRDSGLVEQVTLFESGHECLRQVLPSDALGRTKAVMFNLGYWPGHRRDVMTKPHTTLEALKQALEVLVQGGVVTVVMYSGHEGAGDESQSVLEWAAGLAQKQFHVVSYRRTNQQNSPPQLLAIEKQ